MSDRTLRVGVAGLGGAGSRVLPWLRSIEGLTLAAAADPRIEARQAFAAAYECPAHATVAELCRAPDVDAVYVATPSALHCEHTLEAVRAGKHVLCEKPLATRLDDCDRMIAAAHRAGVLLVQGHSKVLDAEVQAMRQVIESGRLGAVFRLDAWNLNDWMRRPRLASELDTAAGGGVVLRQGPQLVDLARILIGRAPRAVRAVTGQHAPGLGTEGDFSALIAFDGGAAATLSFNGYGHLDARALLAPQAAPDRARTRRVGPVESAEKYRDLRIGGPGSAAPSAKPAAGILTLVSGTEGVLVQSAAGLQLHRDGSQEEIPVPDGAGRAAGLIELRDALREGRLGFPDGPWARTTLEVCLAILESSRAEREVPILGEATSGGDR